MVDSASALEINSPKAKRQRQASSHRRYASIMDDSLSRIYCSQPLPLVNPDLEAPVNPQEANMHPNAQEHRLSFCFSQPAMLENLLVCTQMNQTQSTTSQNLFQRLVRRMTRFFVTLSHENTIKRLLTVCQSLGFNGKITEDNLIITISTMDRRKLQLVFKAHIIEMDGKILLDFRLSKGCGLEFKRRFIKIKQQMEDVLLKGPITWPIAIATNSVP